MNNMLSKSRIAVLLPARLGDTLMCTPALAFLTATYPGAVIDALAASEVSVAVLANNPAIKATHIFANVAELAELACTYDWIIGLHFMPDCFIALLKLASAQLRVSLIPAPNAQHQAQQCYDFVMSLSPKFVPNIRLQYCLYPQSTDYERIAKLLANYQLDLQQQVIIGFHIGCHGIAKQSRLKTWGAWRKLPTHGKVWPHRYFVELAGRLQKINPAIRLLLTGSKSEQALSDYILQQTTNTISLVNQTSIVELAALMHSCRLFISPDTGVMHVACATSVPLLALFGPTDQSRTGPYPLTPYRYILAAPKMKAIKPKLIVEFIQQHLL